MMRLVAGALAGLGPPRQPALPRAGRAGADLNVNNFERKLFNEIIRFIDVRVVLSRAKCDVRVVHSGR